MLRKVIAGTALLWVASVRAAVSQTALMMGADIAATFGGSSFDGVYSDNTVWAETYKADGGISYTDRFGPRVGKWHVEGQSFCTLYNDDSGACWRVERVSDNCFRFYVVTKRDTGTHSPVAGATGWRTGQSATCQPPRPVS